jgi:phosphoglycolate phosphatase
MTPQALLFDLDGTLLDTAPEFTFCLNQLLSENGQSPELEIAQVRPVVSFGAAGLIQYAFDINEDHPQFMDLRQRLLSVYGQHIGSRSQYFAGVLELLAHLKAVSVPWGIVTNKPARFVTPLIEKFTALKAGVCIIAGDTFGVSKPNPLPLLKACEQLKVLPQHCLYIGDAATDVLASHGAGMPCAIAKYGYIPRDEDPNNWKANLFINTPLDIIELLPKA